MEILSARDHESASDLAADVIAEVLRANPIANQLVATGNTPMRAYELLAERADATRATAFQLDEYLGVPEDDERSLFAWMLRSFVEPLAIPAANVRKLDGCADDLPAICAAYDAEIERAGGFDLAILGLGPNGHLGFNEPPSLPDSVTRVVTLTPESLNSNAAYWSNAVPDRALTVGMAQILASKKILLVATGERKRSILDLTLNGPITPQVPASQLRLALGRGVLVSDEAALGCVSFWESTAATPIRSRWWRITPVAWWERDEREMATSTAPSPLRRPWPRFALRFIKQWWRLGRR